MGVIVLPGCCLQRARGAAAICKRLCPILSLLIFTQQDPDQIARALKADDSAGAPGSGEGSRVPRRHRGVQPMRPGYPPVPPPLPPLPQRFGSSLAAEAAPASGGRLSLDSLAPAGGGGLPGGTSSVLVGGGGAAAAAAVAAGSRSVLLPPPNASTYSLQVDPRFLRHGSSYLSAALEQSLMAQAGAGGHLVASTGSAAQPGQRSGGGSGLHLSALRGPADSSMQLVARARRTLPQPAGIAHQMRAQTAVAQRGREPGERSPRPADPRLMPSACSLFRRLRSRAARLAPPGSALVDAAAMPTRQLANAPGCPLQGLPPAAHPLPVRRAGAASGAP